MALFTNDKYTLTSQLSQKEIYTVLKKNVKPKQKGLKGIFRKKGFEGDVQSNSFDFNYTGKSRVLNISGSYTGSDVEFKIGIIWSLKVIYITILLIWLFFIAVLAMGYVSGSSIETKFLAVLGLNLLAVAMQFMYLKSDKKAALQKLSQIFKVADSQ